MLVNDLVDHAVFFGLFRIHDEIALDVFFDALDASGRYASRAIVLIMVRMRRISLAWRSMSVAWPPSPDIHG